MDMFLYLDKDTYMHSLDPRTKIFILLLSFTIPIMFSTLPVLVGIGLVILLYGASGKTLENLKRINFVLIMIGLFSVVIWAFSYQGMHHILGPITTEGLIYGIAMGVKIDEMIIAGMIFLSSTKMEEISNGLVKLKLPYRAAFAFSTAIRLVPTIVGTSYIIIQAQKSRGLDLDKGNIIEKGKKYVPLLIPVFISVIRNTNVFAMALESKGFGYSEHRTNYLEVGYKLPDYLAMVVMVVLLAVGILIKIYKVY